MKTLHFFIDRNFSVKALHVLKLTLFALLTDFSVKSTEKMGKVNQFFTLKIQTFENFSWFPVIPHEVINKFSKQNLVKFHILLVLTAVNRRFRVQR